MDQFLAAGEFAQRACAPIATPFVPNFVWAAVTDLLPAMLGIAILAIFGSKLELWEDLRERLFSKRYPDKVKIMMGDMPQDNHNKVYSNSSPPGSRNKVDLAHVDNPYGSQTNLTPIPKVSFQKTSNNTNGGSISKNQFPPGLEPWNSSAWTTPSIDDNSLQPYPRTISPPPMTNNTYSSMDSHTEFYNSEDLDAVPYSSLQSQTLSNATATVQPLYSRIQVIVKNHRGFDKEEESKNEVLGTDAEG
ncbi:hypothetical protein EC957_003213 [Mortierella hygrophila]|uniref:Uncharacterized protein n=1 Tax=Mortierella hygrophila TaxID=979708 RepID=A0A9P6F445_9FUNG|nr:hypothetical protein EC957_003213 [Mortierella hygrophila]